MSLFYRNGGYLNFAWKPVLCSEAEIPAKRMALFKQGYPTMIAAEAPLELAPIGYFAGQHGDPEAAAARKEGFLS